MGSMIVVETAPVIEVTTFDAKRFDQPSIPTIDRSRDRRYGWLDILSKVGAILLKYSSSVRKRNASADNDYELINFMFQDEYDIEFTSQPNGDVIVVMRPWSTID